MARTLSTPTVPAATYAENLIIDGLPVLTTVDVSGAFEAFGHDYAAALVEALLARGARLNMAAMEWYRAVTA